MNNKIDFHNALLEYICSCVLNTVVFDKEEVISILRRLLPFFNITTTVITQDHIIVHCHVDDKCYSFAFDWDINREDRKIKLFKITPIKI